MANAYKMYQLCPQCCGHGHLHSYSGGEGGVVESEQTCPTCSGNKVVLWGYCTETIYNIPEVPA